MQRISVTTAAHLLGEPPNRLLQQLKTPELAGFGARAGRERALHLGEWSWLRAVQEFREPGRSVVEAFAEAEALAPQLQAWAMYEHGGEAPPRFAFLATSTSSGEKPLRYFCRDEDELVRLVKAGLELGLGRFLVINIADLCLEIMAGWIVAMGGAADYLARIRGAELLDHERARMEAVVERFAKRLAEAGSDPDQAPPADAEPIGRTTGNGSFALDAHATPAGERAWGKVLPR